MKPILPAILLAMLAINTGCETLHHYDVTVTNRLSKPVTVWLTKAEEPYASGWEPPEYLSLDSTDDQHVGGVIIPPGETRHTEKSTKTTADNPAILRIYQADNFNAILALSHGSPDRFDLPLDPGKTDIDVVREEDQLMTKTHTTAPAAAP